MSRWTVELPDLPTWTANSRGHWAQRATVVKAWRTVAGAAARRHRLPALERASVELTMVACDRRRRDPDGIAGALKPALDGLVDAGVLPDDSWRHVAAATVRIVVDPNLAAHRWLLTIVDATKAEPSEAAA